MSAGPGGLGGTRPGPTFRYVLDSLRSRRAAGPGHESLLLARSLDSAIREAWERPYAAWSATTALCDEHSRSAVRSATPELSSLAEALRETRATDPDALRCAAG